MKMPPDLLMKPLTLDLVHAPLHDLELVQAIDAQRRRGGPVELVGLTQHQARLLFYLGLSGDLRCGQEP
jgi:hypothetical protein